MADLVIGVYSWAEAKLVAECSMELQENAEALCQNARLSLDSPLQACKEILLELPSKTFLSDEYPCPQLLVLEFQIWQWLPFLRNGSWSRNEIGVCG